MSRERVVVAMSGGVDSAVAAARCVAAGYDVIGVSLRLAADGGGGCCSLDDFQDAAAVADRLGFPHYVFDARELFERRVVQPFVSDYLAGRTPNPCTRCNQHVKFDHLWQRARELGAQRLATGHYARVGRHPATGRGVLRAARDPAKDQSYFLFMLGADLLERTLFPVGELSKREVRAEAASLGLSVAEKPESMEICFVSGGGAAAFVERRAPAERIRPGLIVDEQGTPLGRHEGIHRYTVGQRRGLGIGGGPRRFVRHIDPERGTVTVAEAATMHTSAFVVDDVVWPAGAESAARAALAVRIRHRHRPLPCRVAPAATGRVSVELVESGPAVTPGQAAVFYDGDWVLGGGWIGHEAA